MEDEGLRWHLERSSKSNGVVGDSILDYEIFYLLDNILAKWPCGFCVPKEEEEEEEFKTKHSTLQRVVGFYRTNT
jgi:hypothetical protein